ncbi:protein bicaudal C homolog 1-like [Acropora muricata]|uniref:protein bicaudal C homolog 1-like n=1 Tax=Acropora muricata TaxID=159855 RepID=UPI0034E53757
MKMATGIELCEEQGDILADDNNQELDPNVVEERFRVDRRKLEQMLQASKEGCGQTGEEFFQKIMEETATMITWPSKLKIGAKSKKDPHIKVAGLPESVRQAKEKIMAVLDTKSSRVTLKMDVSHTDHSHIIGKGGGNIKRVMQDTGCHIHFPDSNRGASNEKSNQVSIAGQPLGVESARQQIRDLLPLVLTFEIPLGGRLPLDASSPAIQRIAQSCNVTINFKQRPRACSQIAIIRGSQQHVGGIKEAISHLVEHFTAKVASSVPVNMQIDIAPQHHLLIIGRNGINIAQIKQQTGAKISFPDPNGTQRKGTVFISGSVEAVINARAQLVDCLPLVLMFDLRDEDEDADNAKLNKIMETYDVFVSVKPKLKQPSKSVIVKSAERNVQNMYLARLEILGLDTNENFASSPTFVASELIDRGHHIPSHDNFTREFFDLVHTSRADSRIHPWPPNAISPTSPTISNIIYSGFPTSSIPPYVNCSTPYSTNPPPPPGLGPPAVTLASLANHVSNGYPFNHSMPASSIYVNGASTGPAQSHLSKSGYQLSERNGSPLGHRTPSPIGSGSPIDRQSMNGSPMRRSSSGSLSPMSPLCTSPLTVEDEANLHGISSGNDLNGSIPYHDMQSHQSNGGSQDPVGSSANHVSKRQTVQILSGAKNVNLQTSTSSLASDTDQLDDSLNSSLALLKRILPNAPTQPADKYDQMKSMATVAMQKKVVVNEVRRPTNTWSGLGFSKSMPESAIKELMDFNTHKKGNLMPYNGSINGSFEHTNSSSLFTSGPRDTRRESDFESSLRTERFEEEDSSPESSCAGTVIGSRRDSFSSVALCQDLRELFEKAGLAKYFSIFQEQEVDFPTFMTLTDDDLRELGIGALGARKKMLLAIQAENSRTGRAESRKNSIPSFAYCSDLRELLEKIDLAKYFSVFQEQEVDLPTFMTLTDKDLKELGISTFGIRKKILKTIQDLNRKPNEDSEDSGRGPAGHTSPPRVFFSDANIYTPPFHRRHPFGIASKSGRW